jgi:hypothetical protein
MECGPCPWCGAGSSAQAASTIQAMWVVILEMILALGLAAFIVWFTWPAKKKPPEEK